MVGLSCRRSVTQNVGQTMKLDEAFAKLRSLDEDVPIRLPLPTSEAVDAAERDLGFRFPSDFRRFLLEVSNVNVGRLEPARVDSATPYRDLRTVAKRGWAAGIPRTQLPFCMHNGDFLTIDANGQIALWCHDDESSIGFGDVASWIEERWIDEYTDEQEP